MKLLCMINCIRIYSFAKITFLISFSLINIQSYGQSGNIKDKQFQVVKLVNYLKNNDQQGVYDMCFHDSYFPNIIRQGWRTESVREASDLIKKYGLPPKSTWRYTDENNYLVSYKVEIPLLTKPDNSSGVNFLYISIIIIFPPERISRLICNFEINKESDHNTKIQAPGQIK
jgi:hypothetical protein